MVPGLALFVLWRRDRDYPGRWIGWWRGLPVILRPVGGLATVMSVMFIGVVLPALGVVFLVEGNLAGKLIGAGVLGLSLVFLGLFFRRRK